MKKPPSGSKTGKKRITFTFKAPRASSVSIVGDFNNWDKKKHPMKKSDKGIWMKTLVLAPRKYEYRFVVDDKWMGYPENPDTCTNCFGTSNNIITVG